MSWSLRLHNGDFVVTGAQLSTVIDEHKLVQDLRCALLERMGTDNMHPDYGSLIDGGRTPDGTEVPSPIGSTNLQHAAHTIQSEIQRVARAYQNQQLDRAKRDRTTYNRVSLSPAEVLLAISNLQMVQQEDAIVANVTLQTARGQDITIALPILSST